MQIALPFLVFVAAGSVALTAWLETSFQRESRARFAALAKTNADFIRGSRLPRTERTAEDLGRILNLEVYFRDEKGELVPRPGDGSAAQDAALRSAAPALGVVSLGGSYEAVAAGLDSGESLILLRARRVSTPPLQTVTVLVLGVFWALTLALAWALTRGLVRPLRLLARRLPHIDSNALPSALPGAERDDEIGVLARTFLATHVQLIAERRGREEAERLALLGKMATGLAHEIHNPLAGIRMHLQLLDSAAPLELRAMAAESIPIALDETAKIENLVNQWMFLARPEPPRTSPANLGELIGGVARSVQALAGHARVEIASRIPAGLRVAADSRRLGQAFGNVMINAIQAMPGGGAFLVSAHNGGGAVTVTFQDSGGGFSEGALAHYADLFYSEKEGGMGIGLSVTSEIVKAHSGALLAENRPGGAGAVVAIELPALP